MPAAKNIDNMNSTTKIKVNACENLYTIIVMFTELCKSLIVPKVHKK